MLEFISVWAQGIIVSVIIATIIEVILPNSSNSKYIKFVIGVFILFTIISPIINKFSSNKISDKINFDSYIDTSTNNSAITTNVNLNNEDTIRKMYEENLKIDIKTKITQKGYTVGNINLDILNNDEYTLSKIDLKIVAKNEFACSLIEVLDEVQVKGQVRTSAIQFNESKRSINNRVIKEKQLLYRKSGLYIDEFVEKYAQ